MTSLVTGATGFIGSHLAKQLIDAGEDVITMYHSLKLSNWLADALEGSRMIRGDVRDLSFLREAISRREVDTVYHLAAESIVKRAHQDPVSTFEINVMGTVAVLEACRQLDVPRVIIQSTDKIYGEREKATIVHPYRPTEPYGTSKLCADAVAQTYINTYDMNISIVRPCNVYGYDLNNRIVPNTIRACLRGENPIIFKGEISRRQYIYIQDFVDALLWITEKLPIKGPVNVATDDILTQEEVVLKILEYFPECRPQYVDKPELKEIASQSMISSLTGWHPKFVFKGGIGATIIDFKQYGW